MSQPAVIFGGISPEHDISILTGLLAARALSEAGTPPLCLYWAKDGTWHAVDGGLEGEDFARGVPKGSRPLRLVAAPGGGFVAEGGSLRKAQPLDISVALNCCHGTPGEDGTLQGALDLAGVAHAGPTVAGAALGMDKLAFGALVSAVGLPSLSRVLASDAEGWAVPFPGPYIVKPRFGGSSIGIEVAADSAAVAGLLHNSRHLLAGAVIEPYLEGAQEIQIAMRAFPRTEVSRLLRPERGSGAIYSYEQKYVPGEGMHAARGEIDPQLPDGIAARIRSAAIAIAARPAFGEWPASTSCSTGIGCSSTRSTRSRAHWPSISGSTCPSPIYCRPCSTRRCAGRRPRTGHGTAPTAPRCVRPARSPASSVEHGPRRRQRHWF